MGDDDDNNDVLLSTQNLQGVYISSMTKSIQTNTTLYQYVKGAEIWQNRSLIYVMMT